MAQLSHALTSTQHAQSPITLSNINIDLCEPDFEGFIKPLKKLGR